MLCDRLPSLPLPGWLLLWAALCFSWGSSGCSRDKDDEEESSTSEESEDAEAPPDPNATCKDFLRGMWTAWGGQITASFDGGALVVNYDGTTRVVAIVFMECDDDEATIQGDGYEVNVDFVDENKIRLDNDLFDATLTMRRELERGVKAVPDKPEPAKPQPDEPDKPQPDEPDKPQPDEPDKPQPDKPQPDEPESGVDAKSSAD